VATPDTTLFFLDDPAGRHLAVLDALPASVEVVVGASQECFAGREDEARAVFTGLGQGPLLRALWPRLGRLEWVHSLSAGVEGVLFPELVDSPVPLTNARGVFRRPLAEFAIAAVFHFAKGLRRMVAGQQAGRWDPFEVEEVAGKTLGIVGYGQTGRATAELARALGMRVLALRRRPERCAGDALVEECHPPERLAELLARSDHLLLAAPLTPGTRGWIGAAELAQLKSTAVLINVGRGPVVVEAALVEALERRRIRGAALDVFDREPLPEGHPFYRLDNVLLSPHCADHTSGWMEEAMRSFVGNCERFVAGQPLTNVVDKRNGY
jgi:phosphoglycerate dehydrogenase-like enzyme